MTKNNETTNNSKPMAYDTVLAAVLDVIKEIPQQGQVQYDLQRSVV